MDPVLVASIVGSVFAGGAAAELVRFFRHRTVDASAVMGAMYPIFHQEIQRLSLQLDRLQALIVALETEVVHLGGDPNRIRQQVLKDLQDPENH